MGGAASRLDEILNGSIRLRYFKLPEGSGQQLLDHFLSLFTTSKLKYAVLALAAYYVLKGISIAIYRLWFHPLARFPGPFLARISTWWEFYYENIQDGQLAFHSREYLHPTYGRVVRVGPNKLRVKSPEDWLKVHGVGSDFTRDTLFYSTLADPHSMVAILDNETYRERRALVKNLFSKRSIAGLEGLVWERGNVLIDVILEGLEETKKSGKEYRAPMDRASRAVMQDIVMAFSMGKHFDLTRQKTFEHEMLDLTNSLTEGFPMGKHVPWLAPLVQSLPLSISSKILPGIGAMGTMVGTIMSNIAAIRDKTYKSQVKPDFLGSMAKRYPGDPELVADSILVYLAGTTTPAWALATALYHLGAQPEIQARLRAEIRTIWPEKESPPTAAQLEDLPFLSAFLKELIRISVGTVGTLPRIPPPEGATIAGQHIPPGTIIDMSPYELNYDETIFPDATSFKPERWLTPDSVNLQKYIGSFGAGSKKCVGEHLAWLELYVLVSLIARRFEVRLTPGLEKEGWVFAERWLAVKRGAPGDFILRETVA